MTLVTNKGRFQELKICKQSLEYSYIVVLARSLNEKPLDYCPGSLYFGQSSNEQVNGVLRIPRHPCIVLFFCLFLT